MVFVYQYVLINKVQSIHLVLLLYEKENMI